MDPARLEQAVADWRKALGGEHVLTDAASLQRYSSNASGLVRPIPAVLQPASTEEVVRVVAAANRHCVPLYPVSCGRNWGLGSRVPPRDGTVVVDLNRMNRIREVAIAQRYAVVEPGVTQGQLYDFLRQNDLPLMLNVTGSARDTSLVGNALERGVGYFASRADSLSGLEVVLGSGELVRTGFGHFDGAKTTHIFRHGVGPSLDGLFAQSNFGIVTAAGVELMPRPAASAVLIARLDSPGKLAGFVDVMADLARRDILKTVLHVGNRHRTQIALAPLIYRRLAAMGERGDLRRRAEAMIEAQGFGPWSAVGGIRGTHAQVREARAAVRSALRGVASVFFLTDGLVAAAKALSAVTNFVPWVRRQRAMLYAVESLYGLAKGIPTDDPMHSAWWPVTGEPGPQGLDPDPGRAGLLYCLPVLPAIGKVVQEEMEHVERVYARHGFTPYITLNTMDDRSLECVINLAFDRGDPARVAAAHACNDELTGDLVSHGFVPYRVGVQSMGQVVREGDPFWKTVRELKKALDPNGIISPGRYNLA